MAASDHLGQQFGVGDVVHTPAMPGGWPGGPVTVDWMNKSTFTGVASDGSRLGRTGRGLAEGKRPGFAPEPWQVERRTNS